MFQTHTCIYTKHSMTKLATHNKLDNGKCKQIMSSYNFG